MSHFQVSSLAKPVSYALITMPIYTREQQDAMQTAYDPWRTLQYQLEQGAKDADVVIPRSWFAIVHRGYTTPPSPTTTPQETLQDLFHTFNQARLPDQYRGPSLSVGHFVWLSGGEDASSHQGSFWLCTASSWKMYTGWGMDLSAIRDCTDLSHQ
jgi:hypothetical protein